MSNVSNDVYLYTLPDFKVAHLIWKVVSPILIFLGTTGNILSIVVLTRKSIRNSTTPLLTFLSITDILVLHTGLLRQWIYHTFDYDIRHSSAIACKIHVWLLYTFLGLSSWIIMALTMERVLATWWPFKIRRICTRTCGIAVVATTVIFLLTVNSHFVYGIVNKTNTDGNGTVVKVEKCVPIHAGYIEFLQKVWTIIDLLIVCLIPFSVILVGNICIIAKLVRRQRRLSSINETSIRRTSSTRNNGSISSLTAMLLVLSTVFLLTTLPTGVIMYISDNYWTHDSDPETLANQQLWWAVSNMLMYTNNSVNFLLYCLSGSRFRKEARRLFCACNKEGPNTPGVLATVTRSDVFADMTEQPNRHRHGKNDPPEAESTESSQL